VNEIAITRSGTTNTIKVEVYMDEEHLTTFGGDGLIFATPTGSTAYAASAGGPIIQNGVPSIAIVPVSPLSLAFRPLILPPSVKIKITVNDRDRDLGGRI
jgi:NAD kinase